MNLNLIGIQLLLSSLMIINNNNYINGEYILHNNNQHMISNKKGNSVECQKLILSTCTSCSTVEGSDTIKCIWDCFKENKELFQEAQCLPKLTKDNIPNLPFIDDIPKCVSLLNKTCEKCNLVETGKDKFKCLKECYKKNLDTFEDAGCKIGNNNKDDFQKCKDLVNTTCTSCNELKGVDKLQCLVDCYKENEKIFEDAGCKINKINDLPKFPSKEQIKKCRNLINETCSNCNNNNDDNLKRIENLKCLWTCYKENISIFEDADCTPKILGGIGFYDHPKSTKSPKTSKPSKKEGLLKCKTLYNETCFSCNNEKGIEKLKCLWDCYKDNKDTFQESGCLPSKIHESKTKSPTIIKKDCKNIIDTVCTSCTNDLKLLDKFKCLYKCFEENKEELEGCYPKMNAVPYTMTMP